MVRDQEPKYVRLARILGERIDDGTYPPGDYLPTISQLCEEFEMTIATVQRAQEILRREGRIETTQGRRAKVLKRRPIIVHSSSYLAPGPDGKRLTWKQQLAELGMHGGQRLGRVGEVPAPDQIAMIFGLKPGDPVLLRPRVMLADDEPVELADSYYPIEVASGTPLAQQRLIRGGSIPVLAEAGLAPVDCTEELTFPLPSQAEREQLNLAPDVRVIRMVRTMFAAGDRPVEVHVMTLRIDRYRLTYRMPVH